MEEQQITESQQPKCLKKFNWGAFWTPIIWGLFNRAYWWVLLSFVPVVNIVVAFYLGFKGNKLSWEAFRYNMTPELFDKKQETWNALGWVIFVLVAIRILIIVVTKELFIINPDIF